MMKLFRMIKFGIRDAFKSVRRNFSLSLASISCITITLLVVSLALLASFNVKNFSKKIESDVSIVIFLELGINSEDVQNFKNRLVGIDNVLSGDGDIIEMNPEERKNDIIENDEKLGPIVGAIGNENEIFHHSFTIKVKDIKKIDETVNEIKQIDNVYTVNYGEKTVGEMISIFDIVEKVAFAIVIVLVIVTIFLIINTINLEVYLWIEWWEIIIL